jgi:hypothetical protein
MLAKPLMIPAAPPPAFETSPRAVEPSWHARHLFEPDRSVVGSKVPVAVAVSAFPSRSSPHCQLVAVDAVWFHRNCVD